MNQLKYKIRKRKDIRYIEITEDLPIFFEKIKLAIEGMVGEKIICIDSFSGHNLNLDDGEVSVFYTYVNNNLLIPKTRRGWKGFYHIPLNEYHTVTLEGHTTLSEIEKYINYIELNKTLEIKNNKEKRVKI